MNILQRAMVPVIRSVAPTIKSVLSPVYGMNSFWNYVRDWYPGAWQNNDELTTDNILAFSTVYACVSLIAQDIGKMRPKLVQLQSSGVWKEVEAAAFSPVLRKPNHFQTRIKFLEYWITSKLIHGNAYILKQRDNRGVVIAMYLLDPQRVTPLVSESGDVFYQLRTDYLSGLPADVTVPAREIIHDLMSALFHPLLGVSPIFACGLAATQGLRIQNNSQKFFANMSRPSGVLTAPGSIADETARRLKEAWESNFGGSNIGKVAVLGDGLKYEAMTIDPKDAQLIEQLKWTADTVCSCFHVPKYKVGVGPEPSYNNVEALNQEYYNTCLQTHIESIELLLDEGLGLVDAQKAYGVELEIESLLRMDSATQTEVLAKQMGAGLIAPDEGRLVINREPVPGGKYPYLQQQNYSLEDLARRSAKPDPFASSSPALPSPDDEPPDDDDPDDEQDVDEPDDESDESDDESDDVSEDAKMLCDALIRGLTEAVIHVPR